MKANLTPEMVEWFFNQEHIPFRDVEKAKRICELRLNGETLQSIGDMLGLTKARICSYVYKVYSDYELKAR